MSGIHTAPTQHVAGDQATEPAGSGAVRAPGRPASAATAAWLRQRTRNLARPVIGVASVLALLEASRAVGLLPPAWFPSLLETGRALAEAASTTTLWTAVGHTLRGWALGLGLAAVLAVPIGLLIGTVPILRELTRVIVEFLRPIPSVALIPLAVLLFSSHLEIKIFLVGFACFWPILFQAVYGVRDVDPVAREAARVYGLPRRAQFRLVLLPTAAPYVATGIRISAAIGLILSVTAELVIGSPGVGQLLTEAQAGGAIDQMYATIVVAGLLGLCVNTLFIRTERRLLHWSTPYRGRRQA